jgi:hypothetical protein
MLSTLPLLLALSTITAHASTGRVETLVPQNRKVVSITIDGDAALTLWDQLETKPQQAPNGDQDSQIKRANGISCVRTETGPHPWISCNFLIDREARIVPFSKGSAS